ncbi:v-ski avian sarcoma viral oncogene-like b, partial [Silurus meridionalis]
RYIYTVSSFRPHAGLQQTLKQFHLSSMSSLGGPAAFSARWQHDPPFDKQSKRSVGLPLLHSPRIHAPSVLPGPLLIAPDRSTERCETALERETISCFVVGGEKRLCLPQILNSVLREFTLQQINAVCDELHIYCSRCTGDQLEILKIMGILLFSAPSCGLITQTDAERLCNSLLHGGALPPLLDKALACSSSELKYSDRAFNVYHECFGKCRGLCMPELYTSPYAACIQCLDCRLIFPTQKFVVHSHKRLENRTCHWGFDSSNWRTYILLDQNYTEKEEKATLQHLLNELKEKYHIGNKHKCSSFGEYSPISNKKSKQELLRSHSEDKEKQVEWLHCLATNKDLKWLPIDQRPSAFRPWSSRDQSTKRSAPSHKHERYAPSQSRPNNPECVALPRKHKQPEQFGAGCSQPGYSHRFRLTKCLPFGKDQTQSSACPTHPPQFTSNLNAEINLDNCDEEGSMKCSKTSWHTAVLTLDLIKHSGPLPADDMTPQSTTDLPFCHSLTNKVVMEQYEGRHRPSSAPSSKLEAMQQMLCNSSEARERFLQEIVNVQVKQKENLKMALQVKCTLRQELEVLRTSKKGCLRRAIEAKHNLRKELHAECERKVLDSNKSCKRLKRELEHERQMHLCNNDCEPNQLRANNYNISSISLSSCDMFQLEKLQLKLQQVEADCEQLRKELLQEQASRQGLEKVVLQLQQQLSQGQPSQ